MTIRWGLGGGVMLDLGVYALNFAVDLLGRGATLSGFHGSLYPNGADADSAMLLTWPRGGVATLMVSLRTAGPGRMVVHGSQGFVEVVPRFHHSQKLVVHVAGQPAVTVDCPWRGEGYVHEIEAASQAIAAGSTEHELNPLDDTLEVQRLMAEALDRLGLHPLDDRTPMDSEESR